MTSKRLHDREEPVFEWEALLPEMRGEVVGWMDETSRALLALTSRTHLAQFGTHRRNTQRLLEWVAEAGLIDLFHELEADLYCEYAGDPLRLLEIAVKAQRPSFVRQYLVDRPVVRATVDSRLSDTVLVQLLGRIATHARGPATAEFLELARELGGTRMLRTRYYENQVQPFVVFMYAYAATRSNHDMLRAMGAARMGVPDIWKDPEWAYRIAVSSCNEETIKVVEEAIGIVYQPRWSLNANRRRYQMLSVRSSGTPLTLSFLKNVWACGYVTSLSAALNAIAHEDCALLEAIAADTTLGEHRLPNLPEALSRYTRPSQRAVMECLLRNVESTGPIQRMEGEPCCAAIDHYMEAGLLTPSTLRYVACSVPAATVFHLAALGYTLSTASLVRTAINFTDRARLASVMTHPAMMRGSALFDALVGYHDTTMFPMLLKEGLFRPDVECHSIIEMRRNRLIPSNAGHMDMNGHGLRQMYLALRYHLRVPVKTFAYTHVLFWVLAQDNLHPSDMEHDLLVKIARLVISACGRDEAERIACALITSETRSFRRDHTAEMRAVFLPFMRNAA